MGQCAPEDSISQCPFLQMIDTAGNPHADGSAAPGARPRHRPSRHRDPPATSRSHDNWMAARQTSCRQQTAPPQPRCSKDVTAHPHRPGARPGRPCPVPARSGQPLSGRSRFSPAFGTEFSANSPTTTRDDYRLIIMSFVSASILEEYMDAMHDNQVKKCILRVYLSPYDTTSGRFVSRPKWKLLWTLRERLRPVSLL